MNSHGLLHNPATTKKVATQLAVLGGGWSSSRAMTTPTTNIQNGEAMIKKSNAMEKAAHNACTHGEIRTALCMQNVLVFNSAGILKGAKRRHRRGRLGEERACMVAGKGCCAVHMNSLCTQNCLVCYSIVQCILYSLTVQDLNGCVLVKIANWGLSSVDANEKYNSC